jgi:hypothetical protein
MPNAIPRPETITKLRYAADSAFAMLVILSNATIGNRTV